jgi:hypothetical protein
MDEKDVIRSQYHAALEMLHMAVTKCPPSLWDAIEDQARFWHVAYHVLFYTHLYLQVTEEAFVPWIKHRDEIHAMGRVSYSALGEPYTREEILAFLAFCHDQIETCVPVLDLNAASGFHWLPFDKRELQFYNIRHLQQHTGELMERLGTRAGIELRWVGAVHSWPPETSA